MVDILKGRQTVEAYGTLLESKAAIEAELALGAMSPVDVALTRDLLARIDRAISPYFD